jgi:hypothetical protein
MQHAANESGVRMAFLLLESLKALLDGADALAHSLVEVFSFPLGFE